MSSHRAGVWSVGNRIIAAATTLLITGMASSRLNVSELAVFLLTTGILAVGNLTDLGVPNAVVTPLAATLSRSDVDVAKGLVVESLRRLIRIALCVLLIGFPASVALTTVGRDVFVPASVNAGDMQLALLTVTIIIALGLPGSLLIRALLAAGHALATAMSGIAAQTIIVLLAVVAWRVDASLPFFVALTSCTTLLTGFVAIFALRRLEPALVPRLADLRNRPTDGLHLSRSATLFLGIGVAGFLGFETDGFVIAAVLGSDEAPTFLVPARVLILVPSLASVYLSPVWPQIAVAAERGDLEFIRRRFRGLVGRVAVLGSLMIGLAGLVVIPLMDAITPDIATPEADLLVVLCAVSFVHTLSVPYAIMLSGLGLLRAQFVSAVAMATTNIALSVAFASWIGLVGPALATVLSQTCLTLVPMTFVIRRRLRPFDDGASDLRTG